MLQKCIRVKEVSQPDADQPAEPGFDGDLDAADQPADPDIGGDLDAADQSAEPIFSSTGTPSNFRLHLSQHFRCEKSEASGQIKMPTDQPAEMDLPEHVFDLDDPMLLRGVAFGAVLWKGARIFSTAQPVQHIHKSTPVEVLDAFLSHNWDTSRWSKFLCLSIHRNHRIALIVTLLLATGIMALDVADQLPYWQRRRGEELVEIGIWSTLLCTPLYWTMVFGDARHWLGNAMLGRKDACVFLDAACIDQNDPDQRKKSIQAIPAFVARSKTMIAILTPLYLQKVWTVFELMTFVSLRHTGKNLYVEPALLANAKLVGSMLTCVGCVLFSGAQFLPLEYAEGPRRLLIQTPCLVPIGCFMILAIRAWGRELQGLKARAQEFDFGNALCRVEADRNLLKDAAATLPNPSCVAPRRLEHLAEVEAGVSSVSSLSTPTTDNTAAIIAQIEQAIKDSVGRSGVPFRYLLGFIVPVMSVALDSLSADLRIMMKGDAPIEFLLQVVFRTCFNIVLFLTVLNLICYISVQRAPLVSQRSGTWRRRVEALACWVVPIMCLSGFVQWTQISAQILPVKERASVGSVLGVSLGFIICLAVCRFMSRSPSSLA